MMSIVDALKSVDSPTLETLLTPFSLLPGYESHLSWLLPATTTIIVTGVIGPGISLRASGRSDLTTMPPGFSTGGASQINDDTHTPSQTTSATCCFD